MPRRSSRLQHPLHSIRLFSYIFYIYIITIYLMCVYKCDYDFITNNSRVVSYIMFLPFSWTRHINRHTRHIHSRVHVYKFNKVIYGWCAPGASLWCMTYHNVHHMHAVNKRRWQPNGMWIIESWSSNITHIYTTLQMPLYCTESVRSKMRSKMRSKWAECILTNGERENDK